LTSGTDGGEALRASDGDAIAVQAAFEQTPQLTLVLTGPLHRIVAANAACRSVLSRNDLVGSLAADVLTDLPGDQILALLDRVRATGRAETGREWRLGPGPGRSGPAELYLDVTVLPWPPGGDSTGLIAVGTDVTAAVLARQAAGADAASPAPATPGVVARLQHELLPAAVPVLPRARIAATYLVPGQDESAGGDWFDAIPLADGRVALVVGDVVGHGIAAAAAMAQLRAVLNELLWSEPDLIAAVSRLNSLAARTPALQAATLAVAVLEPAGGALLYVTCGHPAPLVVGPGSAARFLAPTPGGPLGTGPVPPAAADSLQPGELVLLYSDGLIERPGRSLTAGMAELAEVTAAAVASRVPAEQVCQQAVELLTRTGYTDDVTVLAAERLAVPVRSVHLELPAEVTTLTAIRRELRQWLAELAPVAEDYDGVLMAVVETVTNAIEHAYPAGQPGPILFDLCLRSDGQLDCAVTDHGSWRSPDPAAADRGNGLMVAEHMVDQMLVSHPFGQPGQPDAPAGTVVRLLHRMRRPVMLASGARSAPPALADPQPFAVETEHDGRAGSARVRGPVDITTADEFLRRLLAVCRGGTLPLTVDLSGVTQLASAGVSALYHLARQLADHDNHLELVAKAGGAVQSVLELVGLGHLAVPAGAR
jgi:anti-anti-sigma factor